ncbi:MAG: hypothetical protein AVDCRST_MAG10-811, partial [uncultured Acidimicrobiales bacterium]
VGAGRRPARAPGRRGGGLPAFRHAGVVPRRSRADVRPGGDGSRRHRPRSGGRRCVRRRGRPLQPSGDHGRRRVRVRSLPGVVRHGRVLRHARSCRVRDGHGEHGHGGRSRGGTRRHGGRRPPPVSRPFQPSGHRRRPPGPGPGRRGRRRRALVARRLRRWCFPHGDLRAGSGRCAASSTGWGPGGRGFRRWGQEPPGPRGGAARSGRVGDGSDRAAHGAVRRTAGRLHHRPARERPRCLGRGGHIGRVRGHLRWGARVRGARPPVRGRAGRPSSPRVGGCDDRGSRGDRTGAGAGGGGGRRTGDLGGSQPGVARRAAPIADPATGSGGHDQGGSRDDRVHRILDSGRSRNDRRPGRAHTGRGVFRDRGRRHDGSRLVVRPPAEGL